VGCRAVSITWAAGASAGSYQFVWRATGASTWDTVGVQPRPAPGLTLDTLELNQDYEWKLRSWCDGLGWSDFTDLDTFQLNVVTPPLWGAADSVFVSESALSWNQCDSVETYNFRHQMLGDTAWIDTALSVSTEQPLFRHWLSGLVQDTVYLFQIRAEFSGAW